MPPRNQHVVVQAKNEAGFASVRTRSSSRAERFALGRQLRDTMSFDDLAQWDPGAVPRDPLGLVERSHGGRVARLVGVRVARMSSSPYGFLRGSAVVQAADSAALPATGIRPVVCGDSHLGNFGFYRSPEGEQVLDLNDFDEAHPGAWEWDLRRLTAAIWVAGRENSYAEDKCADAVRSCVMAYRDEMAFLAEEPLFGRSFNRIDTNRLRETITEESLRKEVKRAMKVARKRTSDRALPRFTSETAEGERHIIEEPPLITRLPGEEYHAVAEALDAYLMSLQPHWQRVVSGYHLVDVAHKVVGVGSVGLRAYVALLQGSSPDDVLFLQLKQARRSVLAPYVHGEKPMHRHQGQRVVEYQQALQTVSDPLLGWTTVEIADGPDAGIRHFYVRQFRNMKGTVPLDGLTASALQDYAGLVGHLLAKGHARTSGASMIAGYLGKGHRAAEAFARFARAYADQTEADHAAFTAAIGAGRFPIDEEATGTAFRP